ncbi:MAG: hypothetical protein V4631_22000 [Pseudomonadota bacterium]
MIELRNNYGFPFMTALRALELNRASLKVTPLQRAQAYAADVRARRGMVVRKGFYVDLIK